MYQRDNPNGCWMKDPRPDDAETYRQPTNMAAAGYRAGHRRARYDTAGHIVDREQAERIENFHEQMMSDEYAPLISYDD